MAYYREFCESDMNEEEILESFTWDVSIIVHNYMFLLPECETITGIQFAQLIAEQTQNIHPNDFQAHLFVYYIQTCTRVQDSVDMTMFPQSMITG